MNCRSPLSSAAQMGDFVGFRGGECGRFRGAAVVFGLLWAAREGWWSRWGEHFCGRGIKKGFIRRVRGSWMNLCGDFGRCWACRCACGHFRAALGLIVCGVRAKGRRRGACRCARQWVISGGVGAYRLRSTSQGATPWCLSVRLWPLSGGVGAYRLRSTSQGATPWCLSVR